MTRELSRGTSITKVYKFKDVDGKIMNLAMSGVPIEELINMFKDRLVEVKEVIGNVFLNEGINLLWRLAMGEAGLTPFGLNSCIGVGDGTTPASPDQIGLLGTNKYYKQVDTGFPKVENTNIIFQATFGSNEGNFTWNEWTVANGCGDEYINLNRKVESLGTKEEGYTWILQVTLTIT